MRKILILIVCVLLLASGCTSYEDRLMQQAEDRWYKESKYNDAYQEGYEDASEKFSSSYSTGYDDGYEAVTRIRRRSIFEGVPFRADCIIYF